MHVDGMLSSRQRPFCDRAAFARLSITQTPWIVDGTPPKAGQRVAALAFDGGARYVLPFPCSCDAGTWHNAGTGAVLQVPVIGWCALPSQIASQGSSRVRA